MAAVDDGQTGSGSTEKRKKISVEGKKACFDFFKSNPHMKTIPNRSVNLDKRHPEFFAFLETNKLTRDQVVRQFKNYNLLSGGTPIVQTPEEVRQMVESRLKPFAVLMKTVTNDVSEDPLVCNRDYMPDVIECLSARLELWKPVIEKWVELFVKNYPSNSRVLHTKQLNFVSELHENKLATQSSVLTQILKILDDSCLIPTPFPSCRGIKTREALARCIYNKFYNSLCSALSVCFATRSLNDLTIPDEVYIPPKPVAEVLLYVAGFIVRKLRLQGKK